MAGRFAPQFIWLTLLACAPAGIVFVVLAGEGWLNPFAAATGFAVTAAGIAALLVWILQSLDALARQLESGEPRPAGKRPSFPPVALLSTLAMRRRRERERQTRQVAADLHAIEEVLAALPAPLILLDEDRTVLSANPAASRLLGRDAPGKNLSALLRHPDLLDAAERATASRSDADVEFVIAGPSQRWLAASIRPLPGDADSQARAVMLIQDLTRAKRADQMRADFVANVSHELRTPLSSLIGFIETLRGPASEDADARTRFLEIMQDQAARMSRLVEDLMSLSRIEMDEHSPPDEEVEVVPMLQGLVEMMQLRAGERGMRFEIDVPPEELPILVTGDEDQLAQVFQNLIDNALKYGRDGSCVRVQVRRGEESGGIRAVDAADDSVEDWVSISVGDEGEGISEEHLERLTERFYRVDTARSRRLGGTGLGLAIVKHVLNRHRGRLNIASRWGEGSTFTVGLPAP